MPAVQPQLGWCGQINQRTAGQLFHAGGPIGTGHSGFTGGFVLAHGAQCGNGRTSVHYLMRTRQVRHRQIQKPAFVLIDQAPAFCGDMPMLPIGEQRRTDTGSNGFDHVHALIMLGADHARHTAFDDPCLLARDCGQRVPQELLVIHIDGGDDRNLRFRDHVGGVQSATQTNLEQGVIRWRLSKGQQGRYGRNLEIGDRVRAIGLIAAIQNFGQRFFADQLAGKTDAFVKPRQMGRGIRMHG